jgi:hypothetical protein
MTDIREVINPHDKITIDCSDMDAAQLAVLFVGNGKYGIEGDDGLPLLLLGGSEEWSQKVHGKSMGEWSDSISEERLKAALLSMELTGRRSSISDPVGYAHKIALTLKESPNG